MCVVKENNLDGVNEGSKGERRTPAGAESESAFILTRAVVPATAQCTYAQIPSIPVISLSLLFAVDCNPSGSTFLLRPVTLHFLSHGESLVTPEIDEFADCLRTTLCHPPFFGHLPVFHFTPACIVQASKFRARNAETLSAETLSIRACPMPQTCGVNADVRREREGEGEGNRGRQKSLIRNGFGFKGPCSVRTSYRGPL